MMELGATVCRPRAPRCGEGPIRERCAGCASGGATAPPPRGSRTPGRRARGRIVAALVERRPLPALQPERRERALAALERDGFVARRADGSIGLPGH